MTERKLTMMWYLSTFLLPDVFATSISSISSSGTETKERDFMNEFFKLLDTGGQQKTFLRNRTQAAGIEYDHFDLQRAMLPWIPVLTDECAAHIEARVGTELTLTMRMDGPNFPYDAWWLIADARAQELTRPQRRYEQLPLFSQTFTWATTVLALVTEVADIAVVNKPHIRSPFDFDVDRMESLRKAFQAIVEHELIPFSFGMHGGGFRSMSKKDVRGEVRRIVQYIAFRMNINRAVHLKVHMLCLDDIQSSFLIGFMKDLRLISQSSETSVYLTIMTREAGHTEWKRWIDNCKLSENMKVSVLSGDASGLN
ncbi:hypothetical protein E8E12_000328 [Didymella heteroderae]|uniref:Uncharacterized protein n=1 Tax=Didymella heteroderae TaxID=1769908 RepID=A0A9P4WP92_9PLEO|nr:hypothetical protein E8E12_000328 [Didymella heteroderae]